MDYGYQAKEIADVCDKATIRSCPACCGAETVRAFQMAAISPGAWGLRRGDTGFFWDDATALSGCATGIAISW